MGVRDYSTTAASNLSVGGISIAEGWARSSVNNAYRAGMSDIANLLLDTGGETQTTGSSNAYSLSLPSAPSAYADNMAFICRLNHTATGPATMNINGLGVKDFKKMSGGVPTALASGDARSGDRAICVYSSSANAVLMLNTQAVFTQSGTGAITWPITDRMKQTVYLLDFIPQSEHAAILASTSTFDCADAFEAAQACISVPVEDNPVPYMGGPEIIFPYGTCYFSRTIEMKKTMTLSGQTPGTRAAWASRLEFAANITGITVNLRTTYNGSMDPPTLPIPGVDPVSKSGSASCIRNLKLISKSTGVRNPALNETGEGCGPTGLMNDHHHGQGHGIWVRGTCIIDRCIIQYFPQHGIYIRAAALSAAAPNTPENRAIYGNANQTQIYSTASLSNAGCGMYIDGPDTNACVFTGFDAASNKLSGIRDSSLIGNAHIGPASENNGIDALCSYYSGGQLARYYCRDVPRANGQCAKWATSHVYSAGNLVVNAGLLYQCATGGTSAVGGLGPVTKLQGITDGTVVWNYVFAENFPVDVVSRIPPTGHAESTEVWGFIANVGGTVDLNVNYPPWPYLVDGVTLKKYRYGYAYWFDQSASSSVVINPYSEGHQPYSVVVAPSIVIGNVMDYDAASTGIEMSATLTGALNIRPALQVASRIGSVRGFLTSISRATDSSFTLQVDGDSGTPAANAVGLDYVWDETTGTWMVQHARAAGRIAHRYTTTLNNITGGRAAAIGAGNALFTQGMWLGRTTSFSRHITMGEALPVSGQWAAGDYVLNATPTGVGSILGWRCVTTGDFAGTSPVFQAIRPSTSQQTIVASAVNPAFTLTPATSPYHTLYSGTMTATRPVTLSTTGASNGISYRITRTATGAFDLNVGTGPLVVLAPNRWCDVTFDGTAYYLSAFGSLDVSSPA